MFCHNVSSVRLPVAPHTCHVRSRVRHAGRWTTEPYTKEAAPTEARQVQNDFFSRSPPWTHEEIYKTSMAPTHVLSERY